MEQEFLHGQIGVLSRQLQAANARAVALEARVTELKAEIDRHDAEQRTKTIETPAKVDWLCAAQNAALFVNYQQSAIAFALIGILEQLQLVTTPLYGGSQHAIQTFDNSRGEF